jgi:hypothetical protein
VPAQPVSVSLPASVWAREVSVLRPALASAETASTERSIAVARSTVPVVVRRELQHLHPTLAEEADPRENGMNAEAVDELYIVSLAAVGACLQLLPEMPGWRGQTTVKYATTSCIAAEKFDIFAFRFQPWGFGDHGRR